MKNFAKIAVESGKFAVYCHFMDNERVKRSPSHKYNNKRWILPATPSNSRFLLGNYQEAEFWPEARELAIKIAAAAEPPPINGEIKPEIFENCRPHQEKAIRLAWDKYGYAFFHRMRTGKTFTAIRLANARYAAGQIDRLLVICPTSVKEVWKNQFSSWSKGEYTLHVHEAGGKINYERWYKEGNGLKVLVVGIEALSQGRAKEIAFDFCSRGSTFGVCDESTYIKNGQATRSETAHELGDLCKFKAILTGSEITRAVEDLYSQFRFLSDEIVGHSSYYAFRNRYCIMGGFEKRQVIGYANMDELMSGLAKNTNLVTMEEVAPFLPPKTYMQRSVSPTKEQTELFFGLKNKFLAQWEGHTLTVKGVLDFMTRCQQIAGGFVAVRTNAKDEVPAMYEAKALKANPKLDELMDFLGEVDGKVVIWCRFRAEIATVVARILKEYGPDCVCQYHGGLAPDEREISKHRFQTDPGYRFMVANQQTGAMGIEFSAANTMVYFSNSFTYDHRKQSEERATSMTKTSPILIVDLVLNHKVDKMILQNLEKKEDIAEFVKESFLEIQNII